MRSHQQGALAVVLVVALAAFFAVEESRATHTLVPPPPGVMRADLSFGSHVAYVVKDGKDKEANLSVNLIGNRYDPWYESPTIEYQYMAFADLKAGHPPTIDLQGVAKHMGYWTGLVGPTWDNENINAWSTISYWFGLKQATGWHIFGNVGIFFKTRGYVSNSGTFIPSFDRVYANLYVKNPDGTLHHIAGSETNKGRVEFEGEWSFSAGLEDFYLVMLTVGASVYGGRAEHGKLFEAFIDPVITIDPDQYFEVDGVMRPATELFTLVFSEGFESEPIVVKGNIDGDEDVDLNDAILALRVLIGQSPDNVRPDYASSGADVNGDNIVGMEEGAYIQEKLVRN